MGWALAISPGPANESAQTVSFSVTGNTIPTLFSGCSRDITHRDLDLSPHPCRQRLCRHHHPTGGLSGPGTFPNIDTSAPQVFRITVTDVNDSHPPAGRRPRSRGLLHPRRHPLHHRGRSQQRFRLRRGLGSGDHRPSTTPGPRAASPTTWTAPSTSIPTPISTAPPPSTTGSKTTTRRLVELGNRHRHHHRGQRTPPHSPRAPTRWCWKIAGPRPSPAGKLPSRKVPPTSRPDRVVHRYCRHPRPVLGSSTAVDATTGELTYTPAANANGSTTVDIYLTESGSGVPPNDNTSPTQSFTIDITPVNDAPSFTKGCQRSGVGRRWGPDHPRLGNCHLARSRQRVGPDLAFTVTACHPRTVSRSSLRSMPHHRRAHLQPLRPMPTAPLRSTSTSPTRDLAFPQRQHLTHPELHHRYHTSQRTPQLHQGCQRSGGWKTLGPRPSPVWATAILARSRQRVGPDRVVHRYLPPPPGLFSVQPAVDATTGELTYTPAANAFGSTSVDNLPLR